MKSIIDWPRFEGNVRYRATFRKSMNGEQIGILSDLAEPRCEVPTAWGEMPGDTVLRIEVAPIHADGAQGDWVTWLPFFQIKPPASSGLSITGPGDDGDKFPLRLRVRAVEGDVVLLDLVLRTHHFPLPDHLIPLGQVRYKFLRFDRESRKWIDVHDYRRLDVSASSSPASPTLAEQPETAFSNAASLSAEKLTVGPCPFCGSALSELKNGQNCAGCGSSARSRSLRPLLSHVIAPIVKSGDSSLATTPLLAVSMTGMEKKELSSVFQTFKSISLFGDYGAGHESGVDIRDLQRYADACFSGVFSCGVFDYFIEHEDALRESFRVTAPGGVFMTHILPPRRIEGNAPPSKTASIVGRPGYMEYIPQGQELASVTVGQDWFLETMRRVGFDARLIVVKDATPEISSAWFVGVKPNRRRERPAEIPIVDYVVNACPICGDTLAVVEAGQNCKGCESRARLRSMEPLMQAHLAPLLAGKAAANRPLLSFAMTGAEKKFLLQVFESFRSVSLFGNYGAEHESGVDMRDLSRYPSNSFSGVFGCLLFDYFPEHETALRECHRVIAPGGVFFTHIAPYRLLDGDTPPQLKGEIKKRQGYFDYLPAGTELPDVKVGRDWFAQTMRSIGFDTTIVRIKDATGLISEWFVGVKSGLRADARHTSAGTIALSPSQPIAAQSREVFRAIVPRGEAGFLSLVFDSVEVSRPESLAFLEDHQMLAPDGGGAIREIVAANRTRNKVYVSRNQGQTWQPSYERMEWDGRVRNAFTLSSGERIFRTDAGSLYHFDARGGLLATHTTGAWPWHGSQGIGESVSGTVMYAEYAPLQDKDGVQPLNVWRYRPAEARWTKVFTLDAHVRPPQGGIRHFHVCRPNPTRPSQWILASGDLREHNRLWHSHDDGENWTEVPVRESLVPEIPFNERQRILRFTAMAALPNGDLIWGTDDTLGTVGRAGLIRMNLQTAEPSFHFLGWLGRNCIRNIIPLDDDFFVLISESKHDLSSADCILYDAPSQRLTSLNLPNLRKAKCPVTESLGSVRLMDGVGFLPSFGNVLSPSKRGIVRLRLEQHLDSL